MNRRTIFLILSPFLLILIFLTLAAGLLQTFGLFRLNIVGSLQEMGTAPQFVRQAQLVTTIVDRLNLPIRILFVPMLFFVALILHRLNWQIAGWLIDSSVTNMVRRPSAVFDKDDDQIETEISPTYRPQHRETLQHLIASAISLLAFGTAILLTMLQFIDSAGMAVIATVASTALGFGARDYINDLIMGVSDIFENNFNVGEKVEVLRAAGNLQGVVEKVNIRTALLRTPEGTPIILPHGDMRVLRNFSRGTHSGTSISFQVPSTNLDQSLIALEQLTAESMTLFPELVQPLQLISRKGIIGAQTELLMIGYAAYGQGAGLRLQLLSAIEDRLAQLPAVPPGKTFSPVGDEQ